MIGLNCFTLKTNSEILSKVSYIYITSHIKSTNNCATVEDQYKKIP